MLSTFYFLLILLPLNSASQQFEPNWLPPAQKALQLATSSDGLQYGLTLQVRTSQTNLTKVFLVFDTGSSGIILFNRSICDTCYDHSYPKELANGTTKRVVDGEETGITHVFYACTQLATSMALVGMSASEQFQTEIGFLFGNKNNTYGGAGLEPIHRNGWGNGILGASQQASPFPFSTGCISSFWDLTTNIYQEDTPPSIFSLDLYDNSQPSYLYLGGISESYREALIWSPPSTTEYAFNVYNLSLCGSNVQIVNQTEIEAKIDTGASCLTLPAELFDLIIGHLPLSCGYATDETQFTVEQCQTKIHSTMFYLPDDAETKLPTLSFRLYPDGPWLYLSLSTLILDRQSVNNYWPDHTRKPVCLYRDVSLNAGGKLIFGTLALNSFFVSLNLDSYQVGFANKLALTESNAQCVKRIPCDGMQTLNKAFNVCEDPQCDLYYFFIFDTNSKTCQLSLSFHAVAILVILTFLVSELGMNEAHKWLSTRVVINIEESM